MKKTLIALAALGAMAGAAHAQSTVTLYGLIDVQGGSFKSNTYVAPVAPATVGTFVSLSQTKIDNGALNGPRWGLRGVEDLGGGLKAVFNLESGFGIDTGGSTQGGLLFGRRANVGVSGGFGTVTVGRQSSAYADVAADHAMMLQSTFDPSNTNNGISIANAQALAVAAAAYDLAPTAGTTNTLLQSSLNFSNRNTTWIGFSERFNNSIKYVSPTVGGITGGLFYAFGEDKTATVGASRTIGASLRYANGPILASIGYQSEGGTRTATTKPALENTGVNFAYDFGVARVGLGLNRAKYKDLVVGGVAADSDTFNESSLSVAVPMGALTLSAGVARSKNDDIGKSTGIGFQGIYDLSKRTKVYAGFGSTKTFDELANFAAASGTSLGKTRSVAVGLRHVF
ncbi:MAG: porin [Pseudomonadota bacterium]